MIVLNTSKDNRDDEMRVYMEKGTHSKTFMV
jgi:hypothetical protein